MEEAMRRSNGRARAPGRSRRGTHRLGGLIVAFSGIVAASALAQHAGHEAGPRAGSPRFEAPAPGSYALPAIDHVNDHELLGPAGLPERLLAIGRGELALVSFVYLQCGEACPLSTALLHQVDRALARDPALARSVELVTVSIDPVRDTPAAMAALRDRMAPRARWRFLTAQSPGSLQSLLVDFGQDAVWIPGGSNAPDSLRHVLKVFLVDADGAVRQIYSTGFLDQRLVLADLRTLLGTPDASGAHEPALDISAQ